MICEEMVTDSSTEITNLGQMMINTLTTTGNEVYFPKYNGNATYYFLACPSASTNSICRVLSSGGVSYAGINVKTSGIRPVVCLQSDIPATVTANGIDI